MIDGETVHVAALSNRVPTTVLVASALVAFLLLVTAAVAPRSPSR
jgi:hypothetical protein